MISSKEYEEYRKRVEKYIKEDKDDIAIAIIMNLPVPMVKAMRCDIEMEEKRHGVL